MPLAEETPVFASAPSSQARAAAVAAPASRSSSPSSISSPWGSPDTRATKSLLIEVSPEDIQDCGSGLIANPIARALSRTTKRRWRVWDGRIAQEMAPPYRVVDLPAEVRTHWERSTDFSRLEPFSFHIEWLEESPRPS